MTDKVYMLDEWQPLSEACPEHGRMARRVSEVDSYYRESSNPVPASRDPAL